MTLITEEYRSLNASLHASNPRYGIHGLQWATLLQTLIDVKGFKTVLDYGAGKRTLAPRLKGVEVREYDPAVPEISARPERADLLVCTDVMEHIEPDCLDAVIDDLADLAGVMMFADIATFPADKTLADGRNAHLIVQPGPWWLAKLRRQFRVLTTQMVDRRIVVQAQPWRTILG